ncbi:NAD(P)/FAD-dependent oxidoreductase [Streptomyces sp. Ru71]|uniref:FAD-dependent oxidoreductase n=1 Tax=Streptomyces sp. Ru71 TaxID=2080746 RepID=UPI000CDE1461|nr:FAD-dependent oxidoreductase [Streptomyces sp. Ru71]POX56960.1 NAD(P)/FAD-dependent oxidoreductase [Streptomyces sp. Ru71]
MTAVVVIGAGPAAHHLAARLAHHGHRGTVTVLGAEPRPAYHRALLGSVLDGTLDADRLTLPPLPPGVALHTGVTVTRIDRRQRRVRTGDGRWYPYDVLVLATGARPALPDVPGLTEAGSMAAGVRTLRTADDVRPLPPGSVTVLGGGMLGVETAFALRRAGRDVALAHPGPHVLDDWLDATPGELLTERLRAAGVTVHTGVRAVRRTGRTLLLDDGQVLPARHLLVCTGVVPEADLARAAGLRVERGVLVDDRLRTSDPHVHAIGDCAQPPGRPPATLGSAWDQADALAALLSGAGTAPYRPVPRLLRPRIHGTDLAFTPPAPVTDEDTTVSLSDPARGRFARLVLRGRRVRSAVLIGYPRAIATVGRLYERSAEVPDDRLALLLGTTGGYAADGPLPEDAVVCHCNNVTHSALAHAWHEGARELPALARRTRATTGCGSCTSQVQSLCARLRDDDTATARSDAA